MMFYPRRRRDDNDDPLRAGEPRGFEGLPPLGAVPDPDVTVKLKRCAYCHHALLWDRDGIGDYCRRCLPLWRLRNRVAAGDLSDFPGIFHLAGMEHPCPPRFAWQNTVRTIIANRCWLIGWHPWRDHDGSGAA